MSRMLIYYVVHINRAEIKRPLIAEILVLMFGAGGGSRTRVSALGRLHNSRYTTPAVLLGESRHLYIL